MDDEKRRSRVGSQYLGILGTGVLVGVTLVFTYGRTFHYPTLQEQPPVVQIATALKKSTDREQSALNKYDPDLDTLVTTAQDYVKHKKEYDTLTARPEVKQALDAYEEAQAEFTLKVHGLGLAPIFGASIIGIEWRRRQYKKYGLNKKVLKQ